MFSHYARVLASVPRWSIVPVTRRQYVAEHSYFVSLYVAELLGLSIFDHWTAERKLAAIKYALIHDAGEARMGDTPGPVKRLTVNRPAFDEVEAAVTRGMGYTDRNGFGWHTDSEIKLVVKAADLIDEFFYLNMEASMGSKIVTNLVQQVEFRLLSALEKLPWDSDPNCYFSARTLFAEISEEAAALDAGIETLSNNDDVLPAGGNPATGCTEQARCGRDECSICEGIPF